MLLELKTNRKSTDYAISRQKHASTRQIPASTSQLYVRNLHKTKTFQALSSKLLPNQAQIKRFHIKIKAKIEQKPSILKKSSMPSDLESNKIKPLELEYREKRRKMLIYLKKVK